MDHTITESVKTESLKTLKKLISIPSVNTVNGNERAYPPFGKGIDQALKETLAICEKLGMDTFYDPEGFYGFAECGDGDETVGVLCHLDVVPGGDDEKWHSKPFEAILKDGALYGRGTQDDKGPTVAALYALKSLMDKEVTFKRKVRFIFGTDEEILWRCMDMYKKHETLPDMGFVPDSNFPLTYAEKGLMQVKLTGPGASKLKLKCGESPNVVPDSAAYTQGNADKLSAVLEQMDIPHEVDGQTVTVQGRSVHSSQAQDGRNAISLLAKGLVGFQPHPAISFISEKIGMETNGLSLFGEVKDEITGELTLNVGLLEINDRYSEITLDIRMPVTQEKAPIEEQLKEAASRYGLDYKEYDYLPSLHVPLESDLVQTLLAIYREHTGDRTEPGTSGGATYARSMPNMVAFGARFPDKESLAHQENEHINLDDFYKAMTIYSDALFRLACQSEC